MPKMIKIGVIALTLSLFSASVNAQENTNPYKDLPFKDRLFYGGGLGLSFGDITFIRVTPLVGYNVTPKLSFGLGPTYEYYKDKRYVPDFETTIWGGSVFSRYFVLPMLFLHAELEILNLDEYHAVTDFDYDRVTIPALLLGGGYSQRTQNGSGFFIGIYYDVIGDINSPYPDDFVFRIGGTVAF